MIFLHPVFRHCGIAWVVLFAGVHASANDKADTNERTASGTFVSYKEGTLTLKATSGSLHYKQVGANWKCFENNEAGPGSKPVDTVAALSRVAVGSVVRVDVEAREIQYGLDHRVIGTFVSFDDGKLVLRAAEAPSGFVTKPTGDIALTIDPGTPVLASIDGGDYKFAGPAGTVLKTVKKGETVVARSEYDPAVIEVVQIGDPKRRIERYIGQSRGTVCGTFVSFKAGILRIRGKALTSLAANEYERVIAARIHVGTPTVESIDGGEYRPVDATALEALKEGTVVTIRKVEEVILEIRIGVSKK